jgi:protein-S-isoprenylcysteine O-methyltransferase Ste14
MVAIIFWTLLSLGPIPIWHLLLHLFLPFWKRHPWGFYAAGAALWGLFVPISHELADESTALFETGHWIKLACLGAVVLAFGIAVWSIVVLTPRRFFVWATLRPDTAPPVLIRRGPYRFAAHPTYLAIIAVVAATFLASGELVLLAATGAMASLLMLVMVLERRELQARLAGK